jgi:hypothetical protein
MIGPIFIAVAGGGSGQPTLSAIDHTFQASPAGNESAVILKRDGWAYRLNGANEIQRFRWLNPAFKATAVDVSIYYLSVGMETGDTVGIWHLLGGSGGAQRKFGVTSDALGRQNTLYFSWGDRTSDGGTLGSWDKSVNSNIYGATYSPP